MVPLVYMDVATRVESGGGFRSALEFVGYLHEFQRKLSRGKGTPVTRKLNADGDAIST